MRFLFRLAANLAAFATFLAFVGCLFHVGA